MKKTDIPAETKINENFDSLFSKVNTQEKHIAVILTKLGYTADGLETGNGIAGQINTSQKNIDFVIKEIHRIRTANKIYITLFCSTFLLILTQFIMKFI